MKRLDRKQKLEIKKTVMKRQRMCLSKQILVRKGNQTEKVKVKMDGVVEVEEIVRIEEGTEEVIVDVEEGTTKRSPLKIKMAFRR